MYGLVSRGSRGKTVLHLQRRLAAHGFRPGPLDGVFGPNTEAALMQFQAASHLRPDGIAGDQTWAALRVTASEAPPATALQEASDRLHSVMSRDSAPEAVHRVLRAALGTLGWTESPLGSNDGPEVGRISRGYYSPEDEKKYGVPPWCALAISYWMREGLDVSRYADIPFGSRFGSVSQIERWGKANARFVRARVATQAPPGSIFTMARLGSGSDPTTSVRAGHCGFVIADEGRTVVTIEGNTGHAVQSRTRRKSSFRGWVTWW